MELIDNSFLVSYLVLLGYSVITFIEAVRTPDINVRHIMNIETTVGVIASIVYSQFYEQVKTGKYDLKSFSRLRYIDWFVTTPLILLGLLLFYQNHLAAISYIVFTQIVLLDWAMLYAGYLGEEGTISKETGFYSGFVFLSLIFYLIYTKCIPKGTNPTALFIFIFLWSSYGIAYLQDEEVKNLSYNVLDVFSKALFGVGLWMFYGKVLKF